MGNGQLFPSTTSVYVPTTLNDVPATSFHQKKTCHRNLAIPWYNFATTSETLAEMLPRILQRRGLRQLQNKVWCYAPEMPVTVQMTLATKKKLTQTLELYQRYFQDRVVLHSKLQCADELKEVQHPQHLVPLLYDYFLVTTATESTGFLVIQKSSGTLISAYVQASATDRERIEQEILERFRGLQQFELSTAWRNYHPKFFTMIQDPTTQKHEVRFKLQTQTELLEMERSTADTVRFYVQLLIFDIFFFIEANRLFIKGNEIYLRYLMHRQEWQRVRKDPDLWNPIWEYVMTNQDIQQHLEEMFRYYQMQVSPLAFLQKHLPPPE